MPKLFITDIESDADIKVFVTDIRSDAHLVVYETDNQWEASEQQVWCYTDIRSEADKVVFFTDSSWNADLKIFRTEIQSDAGWVDPDKDDLI